MAIRQPSEKAVLTNGLVSYVHQERWLSYSWDLPLQHQWRGWDNGDSAFFARQFLPLFTLNREGMETE